MKRQVDRAMQEMIEQKREQEIESRDTEEEGDTQRERLRQKKQTGD